jgi:hypothetical protein
MMIMLILLLKHQAALTHWDILTIHHHTAMMKDQLLWLPQPIDDTAMTRTTSTALASATAAVTTTTTTTSPRPLSSSSSSSLDSSSNSRRSNSSSSSTRHRRNSKYPIGNGVDEGFLSKKPFEFFQQLRDAIDHDNHYDRCSRYGFQYNTSGIPHAPRKIYLGALIALEPWELFEIVGTETYGLFAGIVFVEANRTQNFTPRNVTRQHHGPILAKIFGIPDESVMMRVYVNEESTNFYANDKLKFISREHDQRQDIIHGWKEMGMQPEDLGFLADADETFTRDFFRALQYCDNISLLNYQVGQCRHDRNGLKSATLVYESSPDCPTELRRGYRPDLFEGHCIEGIGNSSFHPTAPRRSKSIDRAPGWGYQNQWYEEAKITDGRYPLYNAADMRKMGGSFMIHRKQEGYSDYTGYHLHNFFENAEAIRHKYKTYGHADLYGHDVSKKRLEDLAQDLSLTVRCVLKSPPVVVENDFWNPLPGGFQAMLPPYPIYFADEEYRKARHEFISRMVHEDIQRYNQVVQKQ